MLTLSGANTYTGVMTIISAGTLQLGAAEVIPNASGLTVTGVLDLNGFSETVYVLDGAGTLTLTGANTYTGITTGTQEKNLSECS